MPTLSHSRVARVACDSSLPHARLRSSSAHVRAPAPPPPLSDDAVESSIPARSRCSVFAMGGPPGPGSRCGGASPSISRRRARHLRMALCGFTAGPRQRLRLGSPASFYQREAPCPPPPARGLHHHRDSRSPQHRVGRMHRHVKPFRCAPGTIGTPAACHGSCVPCTLSPIRAHDVTARTDENVSPAACAPHRRNRGFSERKP